MKIKLVQGDVRKALKTINDNSIDLIITSPPYWGLRSYLPLKSNLKELEIGLENHPQEYINSIVDITSECMRVLKKDGNMFLNIGDSWSTATHPGGYDRLNLEKNKTVDIGHRTDIRTKLNRSGENWLKEKQKLFIPYRIAIQLQDLGYIVREDIIWVKKLMRYPELESIGSTMPFPAIDRFLPSHETILHIVKSKKVKSYIDRVKTKIKKSTIQRQQHSMPKNLVLEKENNPYLKHRGLKKYYKKDEVGKIIEHKNWNVIVEKELEGANPTSCVMFRKTINPSKDTYHFAKFPSTLPQLFITAYSNIEDIVMDPFAGSGTTGIIARNMNRSFIGIEINPEYVKKMKDKLKWNIGLDVEFEFSIIR